MKIAAERVRTGSAITVKKDAPLSIAATWGKLLGGLFRWRLSLAVCGTIAAGFYLMRPHIDYLLLLTVLGGFAGCAGCSVLNQIQEQRFDAAVPRTRKRPLVTGEISVQAALAMAATLFGISGLFLYRAGGWPAVFILVLIVFLYNGLYTATKSRSSFSLLAGAAAGALPPVLGVVCAGGETFQPVTFVLSALLFVWQIPHVWLHVQRNKADYENTQAYLLWLAPFERGLILPVWISAFAVMLLALPLFQIVQSLPGKIFLMGNALLLASVCAAGSSYRKRHFHLLNGCLALVFIIPVVERMME